MFFPIFSLDIHFINNSKLSTKLKIKTLEVLAMQIGITLQRSVKHSRLQQSGLASLCAVTVQISLLT